MYVHLQAARLREAEPALQRAAERSAATASMAERVEMNAAAEERKARLRQEEVCTVCHLHHMQIIGDLVAGPHT